MLIIYLKFTSVSFLTNISIILLLSYGNFFIKSVFENISNNKFSKTDFIKKLPYDNNKIIEILVKNETEVNLR
jgi:hypothetical protein